jgi:hypothetical protein
LLPYRFSTAILDQVLFDGTAIYAACDTDEDYLLVSDLPHTAAVQQNTFAIAYGDSLAGDVHTDTVNPNTPYHTLTNALRTSLASSSRLLLTIGTTPASTCAIFKSSSQIYIFDPHSCDHRGMPDHQGTMISIAHFYKSKGHGRSWMTL